MAKEKKKSDPVVTLLNFIIFIMIFVMLAVGYRLFFYRNLANRSAKHTQDASKMSFELSRNDYAYMIRGKYMNEINGIDENKSYHALANYVEALSKYKIYEKKGYSEKAAKQKEIMENSRIDMAELTVYADDVDEMFSIIP